MEGEKFAAHRKWRGFFGEYIIVVLGVITALAAQQSVEYFHDRHQLDEARRQLRAEAEDNRGRLNKNLEMARTKAAELDANMALLHATPASPAKIAPKLVYSGNRYFAWPQDGAWQAAKQNGSLGLMPYEELRYYTYMYDVIAIVKKGLADIAVNFHKADAIWHRSPEGDLTAHDIEELITATSEAQASINSTAGNLHFEERALQPIQR
jgi:hypothetical protein